MLIIGNRIMLHPDFYELSDYLGPAFRLDWCDATDDKLVDERARYTDEIDFVRNTQIFCYQSIGLAYQGIHRPYLAEFLRRTANQAGISVIDVGAGGGQFGLALHTLGYSVSFADIYSQSQLFTVWRLRRRGLTLPVFSLDDDWTLIPRHDWATCLDVLEHLTPEAQRDWLERLARLGKRVLVNLIAGEGGELPGVHRAVDVDALLGFVRSRWPVYSEAFYGGRQHLLIYGEME